MFLSIVLLDFVREFGVISTRSVDILTLRPLANNVPGLFRFLYLRSPVPKTAFKKEHTPDSFNVQFAVMLINNIVGWLSSSCS